MAPPPAAPPLPVAPDHAVVANRIALLFSKQSAVAASLHRHLTPSRREDDADDDDDDQRQHLAAAANPNAGAGYLPPDDDKASSGQQQDRSLLRNRLLGSRGGRRDGAGGGRAVALNSGRKAALCESESDDDQGRSALGRRKRPVREVAPQTAAESNRAASGDEAQQGTPEAARDQKPQEELQRHVAKGWKNKKRKRTKNRASESI
ncbi:hypothetical protein G6O67_005778 [Ophiocordyceps sinensis]|uniref:Uncharacterized protein n=1 Tax=Ophiocordyceps sinensis TaxID=72228 RepID=A0A8H4LX16_9HYPO|nr:hypothetical protein G6O67_005778 [Ophiocordyceps sinensis]